MAILYISWRDDEVGQSAVAQIRSDCKGFNTETLTAWQTVQKQNSNVVLITKGRTDQQSPWSRVCWQRPDYADPIAYACGHLAPQALLDAP